MVSKTAVWKWVVKLREKLQMASERKARRFIAVDETCVKVDGEQYWVLLSLKHRKEQANIYRGLSHKNSLTTESFIKGVLRCKRAVEGRNLFYKTFTYYYNHLRR